MIRTIRKLIVLFTALVAATFVVAPSPHRAQANGVCHFLPYGDGLAISSLDELVCLKNHATFPEYINTTIYQTADIELNGWNTPIVSWYGTFDGGGFYIEDLDTPVAQAPLFTNPGGSITITNTHRTGEVSGTTNVGAFIEFASGQDVWISNSSMDGEVTGTGSFVGGFIGRSYGFDAVLSIINSSVTGLVEGADNVGGFVGSAEGVPGQLTITDSSATSSVSGDFNIGGLVGNAMTVELQDSSVDATVEGTLNVGGLIGFAQTMATVTNSESRGSLPGDGECDVDYETMKGGLIGITPSARIEGS